MKHELKIVWAFAALLLVVTVIAPEGGTITLYPEDIAAIRDKIGGMGNA